MTSFRILPSGGLDAGVSYQRPRQSLPERVTMESPAIDIMTDLSRVTAETVSACLSIDEAEQQMIASNIRMLFVTNRANEVIGIVTANDLSGERIMRLVTDSHSARKDLIVRDLMTPQHKVEVLEMSDLTAARVGDIVSTLKRMGRQHALVVDRDPVGKQSIRGVLSTTQIGRQLGKPIETIDLAENTSKFATAS